MKVFYLVDDENSRRFFTTRKKAEEARVAPDSPFFKNWVGVVDFKNRKQLCDYLNHYAA